LLRDLVDLERLAAAQRQSEDDRYRRGEFSHYCPPGVCRAVGSAEIAASNVV
jgi:hypothetical protein